MFKQLILIYEISSSNNDSLPKMVQLAGLEPALGSYLERLVYKTSDATLHYSWIRWYPKSGSN